MLKAVFRAGTPAGPRAGNTHPEFRRLTGAQSHVLPTPILAIRDRDSLDSHTRCRLSPCEPEASACCPTLLCLLLWPSLPACFGAESRCRKGQNRQASERCCSSVCRCSARLPRRQPRGRSLFLPVSVGSVEPRCKPHAGGRRKVGTTLSTRLNSCDLTKPSPQSSEVSLMSAASHEMWTDVPLSWDISALQSRGLRPGGSASAEEGRPDEMGAYSHFWTQGASVP